MEFGGGGGWSKHHDLFYHAKIYPLLSLYRRVIYPSEAKPRSKNLMKTPPHEKLIFSDHCAIFIDEWLQRYGQLPIAPRPIISEAIEDPIFWGKLVSVITPLVTAPQPHILANWLKKYENLPFYNTPGERFRFTRVGHKWHLKKFPTHQASETAKAA